MAAPEKAPTNACEDEDGIPNHQVSRFQKMAAIKARKNNDHHLMTKHHISFYRFCNGIGNTMIFKNKKGNKIKQGCPDHRLCWR